MTIWEDDLDYFFNDFSVEATLGSGTKIKVLFDLVPDEMLGIENADIQITAKYSDVQAMDHDDTLTIKSVVYKLKTTPRDQDGISILKLSRD